MQSYEEQNITFDLQFLGHAMLWVCMPSVLSSIQNDDALVESSF